MLRRIEQVEDRLVETEVCIIGGGPAGITLALRLAESGRQVVLLEGGGFSPPSPEAMDLYQGSGSGYDYPLAASRLRYLGGTSNHWGGWCRPLDQEDFAAKAHIPHSGWPLIRSDLDNYYPIAHKFLQIEEPNYYADDQPPFSSHLLPSSAGLETKYFRFSPPTRFGKVYREAISSSPHIDTIMNANAVALEHEHGVVSAVKVRSLQGKALEVRARKTILAMGGLENTRFLLNTGDNEATALGNQSDWLGRCFMDHTGWRPGILIARPNLRYSRFLQGEHAVMPVLSLGSELMKDSSLQNACALLKPISKDQSIEEDYFSNSWLGKSNSAGSTSSYILQMIFEPSPCRESRVTLSDERDALGQRRLHLNWAFNKEDFERLSGTIDHIVSYLGQFGLGRLKMQRPVNDKNIAARKGSGLHHMGTTRMSDSPAMGVVDRDCRVHHCQNLFVAGSSVFPTVGFSNPTLTIVALAARLADTIEEELQS